VPSAVHPPPFPSSELLLFGFCSFFFVFFPMFLGFFFCLLLLLFFCLGICLPIYSLLYLLVETMFVMGWLLVGFSDPFFSSAGVLVVLPACKDSRRSSSKASCVGALLLQPFAAALFLFIGRVIYLTHFLYGSFVNRLSAPFFGGIRVVVWVAYSYFVYFCHNSLFPFPTLNRIKKY
jgi:hypothetical protein